MTRRAHVPNVVAGRIELPAGEAHHVRDVLRLESGDELELFDSSGQTALATIDQIDSSAVFVIVDERELKLAAPSGVSITIASAVPKGDRADWMIEKLSEVGVARFIPLITARSVVLPVGKNKRERWQRIAKESAKQSRRSGVMQIDELTPLKTAIGADSSSRYFLSTDAQATPILHALSVAEAIAFFIGPEGGWTDNEIATMRSAGMDGLRLTSTILRVETAAVVAAAAAGILTEQRNRRDAANR
ncbi:MAG: 16S rRNA (uracil(1498)-N(3))-methyltransferase [Anaerolineae bacterium]|nr:16S rRNA (uracil(1498)-N(3))-methyltransferase [Phycisphaerae bacterium]